MIIGTVRALDAGVIPEEDWRDLLFGADLTKIEKLWGEIIEMSSGRRKAGNDGTP